MNTHASLVNWIQCGFMCIDEIPPHISRLEAKDEDALERISRQIKLAMFCHRAERDYSATGAEYVHNEETRTSCTCEADKVEPTEAETSKVSEEVNPTAVESNGVEPEQTVPVATEPPKIPEEPEPVETEPHRLSEEITACTENGYYKRRTRKRRLVGYETACNGVAAE